MHKIESEKCPVCSGLANPDYKVPDTLFPYLNADGKLLGRNNTGFCEVHQQSLAKAVKRARELGLVPK